MGSALANASVTAVLKDILGNGIAASPDIASVGDVSITAVPPDRISVGAEERNQINLFLYRVAPHTSLSNGIGSLRKTEKTEEKPRAPRLGLDLFYLLTAYGAQDFHTEILLGCAMQMLLETPVLTAERITTALGAAGGKRTRSFASPVMTALANSDLSAQVEQIKLIPQFLSFEDMSKLWSAMQARYRPSVAYQVSAVVINGKQV